jgi:predicted nucleotidyltransferase
MTHSAIKDGIETRNALCRYFECERPVGVVSVYLYGSRARGTPHRESDTDVAVLLDYAAIRTRKDRARFRVELMSTLIHELTDNKGERHRPQRCATGPWSARDHGGCPGLRIR